jgi:hypothetical protein
MSVSAGILPVAISTLHSLTPYFRCSTLCPLLSPRLLPLLGTASLVTRAVTLWLSLVTVPIFLALDRLMSISATRASWVAMFDFCFLPPLHVRRMPLILFTVICGLLQFLVFLATILSWLMISLTTLGLTPCVPSLRHFHPPPLLCLGVHSVRPHH